MFSFGTLLQEIVCIALFFTVRTALLEFEKSAALGERKLKASQQL